MLRAKKRDNKRYPSYGASPSLLDDNDLERIPGFAEGERLESIRQLRNASSLNPGACHANGDPWGALFLYCLSMVRSSSYIQNCLWCAFHPGYVKSARLSRERVAAMRERGARICFQKSELDRMAA
jgi:hypothetical protein